MEFSRMGTDQTYETVTERLASYLSTPSSQSTYETTRTHQVKTICYSYICPYASRCSYKTKQNGKVLVRNCAQKNKNPELSETTLSELSLDLLAIRRARGGSLDFKTIKLLDAVRPNGPLRRNV